MKKPLFAIIFFTFAGIIFVLGIWQMVLAIPPQLTMLSDALLEGVSPTEVSDYRWQQLVPQILTYIITTLGFTLALCGAGVLCLKLDNTNPPVPVLKEMESESEPSPFKHLITDESNPQNKDKGEDELDEFLEDFQPVDEEKDK